MEKSLLLKVHPATRVSDWSLTELKEINFKITLFRGSNTWQVSRTTQESGVSLVNSFGPTEGGGNHGAEVKGDTQQD